MPPVSERQRKAMHAAADGKSTIGITKKVGAEFSAADKGGKLPKTAKKMQASTKKRDAPNVGRGDRMDFKGTNGGYTGATKDRNTASMVRERANKASGEGNPAVDRSAHWKGNPGFPSSPEAGSSPPPTPSQSHEQFERETVAAGSNPQGSPGLNEPRTVNRDPHSFPTASNSQGYGHSVVNRSGHLRLSGHSGAHRIGKK